MKFGLFNSLFNSLIQLFLAKLRVKTMCFLIDYKIMDNPKSLIKEDNR